MDELVATAQRLHRALDGAVIRSLRRQDSICIATAGGLDSSILAALLMERAEVPAQLVAVAAPGSVDSQRARALARHLDAPLDEILLTRPTASRLLEDVVPLIGTEPVDAARAQEWGLPPGSQRVSPIRAAVTLVLLGAAEEAARFAQRLVLGQGADEWFAGYARYERMEADEFRQAIDRDRNELETRVLPIEARIANHAGIRFEYPFLNDRVRGIAQRIPATSLRTHGERKPVLRALARELGLPDSIVNAPKTAAQYGSGAAEFLRQIAQEAGRPQNEFLTAMYDQRRIGEPHSLRT